MARNPEAFNPNLESWHQQETPRKPIELLKARNSLQRMIKAHIDDQKHGIKPALAFIEKLNIPTTNTYLRWQIEKGKEEGLDYALGRNAIDTNTHVKPIHTDIQPLDAPHIESFETVRLKTPQEIMIAKHIFGKIVDELSAKKSTELIDANILQNEWKLKQTLDKFARNMGRLQSLNYILSTDDDGGISKIVEKHVNNLDQFKHRSHP